ncbi:fimbrial protein [Salmonella enterica]|nr:fimbrial protein [Salmonella enterica]ECH8375574.1 fimbrial protein [Salmonella enterica subsp. enterica]EAX2424338.1 fimbrial protein [Salmonella enterica]EDV6157639.1 fimbrial protein [Salmonella enterica subsp. enterica]EFT5808947.1 fimbrial protein [Salmonella enterica]
MKYRFLTLVVMAAVSRMALADNVTRVDLGSQVLRVSQPLNEVFGQQPVTLPALCKTDCNNVKVKWEVVAPLLPGAVQTPGVYRFDSGRKGIALQIDAPQGGRQVEADQPLRLKVGLVRTEQTVEAGTLPMTIPLLKWTLVRQESDVSVGADSGEIVVTGTLTAGSCEPKEGTLTFRLPPVQRADLQKTVPGQPVKGVEAKQSIAVTCTPGVASKLSALFQARTAEGNPGIVLSDENPGVGFMVTDDVKKQTILWDRSQALEYPIPATGQTQIPLTAFYTPTGKPVEAGKVSAQAQFTIDYQ